MRSISVIIVAWAVIGLPGPSAADVDGLVDFVNIGCTIGRSNINGCLLTANARSPIAAGGDGLGTREGKACGWNILSLFAWGDLRVQTAMDEANITKVTSIDSSAFELIPLLYGINRYCTIVSGT